MTTKDRTRKDRFKQQEEDSVTEKTDPNLGYLGNLFLWKSTYIIQVSPNER